MPHSAVIEDSTISFYAASPPQSRGEGRIRMTEKARRVIYELIAAISSHDVEKLAAFFTENCFYEDVAFGSIMLDQ